LTTSQIVDGNSLPLQCSYYYYYYYYYYYKSTDLGDILQKHAVGALYKITIVQCAY